MALEDDLYSYHKLDEASGTRACGVTSPGQDLSDNNTVGTVTGHVTSVAADFEASSSEYLNNTGSHRFTADFSGYFWANRESGSNNSPVGLWTGSNRLFTYYQTGGAFYMYVSDGSSNGNKSVTASGMTGNWRMYTGSWDMGVEIAVSYDGGTLQTGSTTLTHNTGASDDFLLSRYSQASGIYWDGHIEEMAFWDRIISSTDVSDLWNSGNGQELTPGGGGGASYGSFFAARVGGVEFRTNERSYESVRRMLEAQGRKMRHATPRDFGIVWCQTRDCLWAPAREILIPRSGRWNLHHMYPDRCPPPAVYFTRSAA